MPRKVRPTCLAWSLISNMTCKAKCGYDVHHRDATRRRAFRLLVQRFNSFQKSSNKHTEGEDLQQPRVIILTEALRTSSILLRISVYRFLQSLRFPPASRNVSPTTHLTSHHLHQYFHLYLHTDLPQILDPSSSSTYSCPATKRRLLSCISGKDSSPRAKCRNGALSSDHNMNARPTNSYLARRPVVLGLAKILFLSLGQLPLAHAAPLFVQEWFSAANEPEPKGPDDPSLWIYLSVAAVLVLLGGAFAGLTIALMGQVSESTPAERYILILGCRMNYTSRS